MSNLKTTQNTPEREEEILTLFCGYDGHQQMSPVFEHGHWWIICSPCGASWDVCDAEGVGTINGYSLEQVSEGDGYCSEHGLLMDANGNRVGRFSF